MQSFRSAAVAALIAGLVSACGESGESGPVSCDLTEGIVSICGQVAPEDIERTPDNQRLIYGYFDQPGGVFALDPSSDAVTRIFGEGAGRIALESGWGDPACTTPPPWPQVHGLDVRVRQDGRWQLLVVNHADRESVEFFELDTDAQGELSATWRGCVVAPDSSNLNDVVALDDGGFLVTHMAPTDVPPWRLLQGLMGRNTGHVYRWHPERGLSIVPNSEANWPNGIALAPDGGSYYLNEYFGNRIRHHRLPDGELLAQSPITQPDNSAWTEDGKLLVASHPVGLMELLASLEQANDAPSLLPFDVIEVDPDTLTARVLLSRDGAPMGAGTVALQHGAYVYIGSYTGDRIIKVPLN